MAAPAADPVAAPAAAVADQALDDGLVMEAQGGVAATAVEPGSLVPAPAVIGRQGIDMVAGLPEADTEAFANAVENPVKVVTEAPVSTFSIDVDTASYAIIRQSLNAGQLPPPDAVRVEEMVNYFPYDYPAPAAGDAPFRPTITVMDTPWNSGTDLVHIALQGRMPAIEDRPPLNLVFLIDTSGSMEDPTKLPLLKQSFRLMLEHVGSDLHHVVHVNVFLLDMRDFDAMNRAYVEVMGMHRPARTVIGVRELPKPGVLLTMNLTAVARDD